jgi:DNA-binding transcriptional LysR family regulator
MRRLLLTTAILLVGCNASLAQVSTMGTTAMGIPSMPGAIVTSPVAACIAGQGVFQMLAPGLKSMFAKGELVQILPQWSDERYPLYAYHPSRHLPPVKVRAFLDFVQEIAAPAVSSGPSKRHGRRAMPVGATDASS